MERSRLQTDALVQNQPNFQSTVMLLDNNLHDEDVDSMKFLCQGLVVGSKLKRVDNVLELVKLLESANQLTETDTFILADLLQYIQRIDILESIGYEEREVVFERRQRGSRIKPFFVLLFQIAEELPDEDVQKAAYMYGKVPRSQKLVSGMDLFTVMVQHQAITPDDVGLLINIFQSIERQDLVELINKYTATQGMSVIDDLEERFNRAMTLRGHTASNPGNTFGMRPQDPPQPQKGQFFGNGFGPSIHDVDISNNASIRPVPSFSTQVSDQFSTNTNPPFTHPVSPSAPPRSMPSFGSEDPGSAVSEINMAPSVSPAVSSVRAVSVAPEGYDIYEIPWPVLDVLSRNIPAEYWQDFSTFLGVPVTSNWPKAVTRHHCLAVLKKWLDLPEARAMDSVCIKVFLVRALAAAGPLLMAQEIAVELNIDYAAVVQESAATQATSVFDENDVASTGTAAPESMSVNQTSSLGSIQVAPAARQMALMSLHPNPIPFYKMDRIPRGFCVIINNRDFYKDPLKPEAKQMISREGTDVDRDKLKATFLQLNFLVMDYDNCSDYDMISIMQRTASENHRDYDCFVCCILTHGVQGALYGVNGMTVPIRDMTGPFRGQACPTLSGKPKLFFMQACQGREKQEGYFSDMQTDAMETDSPPELIPNESDFLLGYATVPGFVSYRSKTRGSWYITKLTESLNKHAFTHDILDILTLVNFEVGKGDALIEGGQYKQSPAPMYSLRKKLIFSPPF